VKAYRFRLQSVLRVRQLQEQAAAQQLAVALRDLQGAQSQLADARRCLAGLAAPSGRHVAGDAQWTLAQSGRMSEKVCRTAGEVEAAQQVALQARKTWGDARQRTAVLERLDERHVALWRAELDRSEAAALDDLAIGRNGGEGFTR
jgi:flagellar export protein FliJ